MSISNKLKGYLNIMNSTCKQVSLGDIIQGIQAGTSLDSSSITTAKIASSAVTAAKLASDAVETAKIKDANVTLAKLASGITPSHVVKFAGKHTSSADVGGVNAVAIAGVVASDIVLVSMQAVGVSPVTILTAIPSTDTVTITFSADPSTDHVVSYMVIRAAA